jgi:hypothetical protein
MYNVAIGCAINDCVDLMYKVLQMLEPHRFQIDFLHKAIEHGSLGVLNIPEVKAILTSTEYSRYFQSNFGFICPKNVETFRWISINLPWACPMITIQAFRMGRMDLILSDYIVFKDDISWNNTRNAIFNFNIEQLRYLYDRHHKTKEIWTPVQDAQSWLQHHHKNPRSLEPLVFLVKTAKYLVMSEECFSYVYTIDELNTIIELGAPWPKKLENVNRQVVDAAVLLVDCPFYEDWASHVTTVPTLRLCVERGWPLPADVLSTKGVMTLEKLQELIALGAEVTSPKFIAKTWFYEPNIFKYIADTMYCDELWDVIAFYHIVDNNEHFFDCAFHLINMGKEPTESLLSVVTNKSLPNTDTFTRIMDACTVIASENIAYRLWCHGKYVTLSRLIRQGRVRVDNRITDVMPLHELVML